MSKAYVVLDMDETLLHSMDMPEDEDLYDVYDSLPKFLQKESYFLTSNEEYAMWGLKRKGADNFIATLRESFTDVILWSAGEHDYVHACVQAAFPNKFDAIYTRKDCYKQVVDGYIIYKKPLVKLRTLYDKDITEDNVVVVDDSCSASSDNFMNHIRIDRWSPETNFASEFAKDNSLPKLTQWVSNIDFRNIRSIKDINLSEPLGLRKCAIHR